MAPPLRPRILQPVDDAASDVARRFAFCKASVDAADAGRLARAQNIRNARLLPFIDRHKTRAARRGTQLAAEELREFGVRNEPETAGQIIARDAPPAGRRLQFDTAQTFLALHGYWPAIEQQRHSAQFV